MTYRNLISIVVLAGIGLFFLFFFLRANDGPLPDGGGNITELYSVTIIEESFDNSVHKLSGVVVVPTPCHQVTVLDVLVAESYPEQVRVLLSAGSESEMCAQVITEKPFSVTFNASQEATVTFLVNNQTVRPEYISNEIPIILNDNSLGGENNIPATVQ